LLVGVGLFAAVCPTEPSAAPSVSPGSSAGAVEVTSLFLLALPRAVALIAGRIGPSDVGPDCPAGGRLEVVCEREGASVFGRPTYRITAVDCSIAEGGQSLLLNASARLTARREGTACFAGDPGELDLFIAIARLQIGGASGLLLTLDDLAGSLSFDASAPPCTAPSMSMSVNGEAEMHVASMPDHPMNEAEIRIADIRLRTEISRRGSTCTPLRYTTIVDGGMGLRTAHGVFAALYSDFALAAQVDGKQTQIALSGRLLSDCFGSAADFATDEAVRVPEGDACFRAGSVDLRQGDNVERLRFLGSGGVEVGSTRFASCIDPELFRCGSGERNHR
jgi:hypothetical protein